MTGVRSYSRKCEIRNILLVTQPRQTQLAVTSPSLLVHRQAMPPHTVDRFANCKNAPLRGFNSKYLDPMLEGGGRTCTDKLALGKQFRLSSKSCAESYRESESRCNSNCTFPEGPGLVSDAQTVIHSLPH